MIMDWVVMVGVQSEIFQSPPKKFIERNAHKEQIGDKYGNGLWNLWEKHHKLP